MAELNAITLFFVIPFLLLGGFFLYAHQNGGGRKAGAVQQMLDLQYADMQGIHGAHWGRVALIALLVLMIAAVIDAYIYPSLHGNLYGMAMGRMIFTVLFIPILTVGGVVRSLRPTATQWTYGLCISGVIIFFLWITGLA